MRVLRYSETSIDSIKRSMMAQNRSFVLEYKSGNRAILINGAAYTSQEKKPYMKALRTGKGKSLIGNVRKCVHAWLKTKNFEVEEIEQIHNPTQSYKDRFKKLDPGTEFYYVDIKHCYWRIAYLMGIVPKNLYNAYKDSDEHKITRNIALSTLASKKAREYYYDGKLVNAIECDTDLYKTIYTNIRYTAYNNMGYIDGEIGENSLGYLIDGIYTLLPGLSTVRTIMKNRNYNYRTIKCEKIDNKYFLANDKKKEFR